MRGGIVSNAEQSQSTEAVVQFDYGIFVVPAVGAFAVLFILFVPRSGALERDCAWLPGWWLVCPSHVSHFFVSSFFQRFSSLFRLFVFCAGHLK